MSTGKLSIAIGCLSDNKTKRALPLSEVKEGKSLLTILKKNTPKPKQRTLTI